ncbi:hypothetical protein BDY17DRAFT_314216 [Neohortaea acidophila]|uniref:Xylanolytic transcriptional activator regulatory domain-containing protein n=1 Tax=Neohortaea acidophila TaxID=245834 RepID=A0A6A6PER1_9PEZI|nr:uncharacterized protein BDY17DRAFT_314216 [Neohortaea acidophila]KAF2478468.1 hypothetical protein BDY17DRAFT_314216 [Neohortaea acidophila]
MTRTCGAFSDASRTDYSTARPQRPYRNGVDKALFINAFYTHFHPNHPFLVPQPFYSTQQYPNDLDYVVCLIGQFYLLGQSDDGQIDAEIQTLSGFADAPATLAGLQTLLLCSIVLHSLHRPDETGSCLKRAQDITQELFSNSAACASLTTVEEESTRRTWWELYTVDTYLAALHRRPASINDSDAVPPALPGATKLYKAASVILILHRWHNWSEEFSLKIPFDEVTADDVEAVDNALASWKHYLPEGGAMLSEDLGHLDVLYFQAHSFVHTAPILIHFPRSDLPANVPSAKDIFCIANHPRSLSICSQHTMKAIAASKEIGNMAAMPVPAEFFSALFVCALNLACIVQLAAGIKHIADPEDTYLQRRNDFRVLWLEEDVWSNLTWSDLFSPEEMNRLMEQSESSVTL